MGERGRLCMCTLQCWINFDSVENVALHAWTGQMIRG